MRQSNKPRAACSKCGKVGKIQPIDRGVRLVCKEHGAYFNYKLGYLGKEAIVIK